MPVSDVFAPQQAPELRVFGDPGTTERFALPNYIYFFVVKQDGEDWVVCYIEKAEANPADWEKTRYSGLYETNGDSVFQYTKELRLLLPDSRFNGRVYIIASAVALTFNNSVTTGSTTLEQLLNLKFTIDGYVKTNLQNIYSTPYNYIVSGNYYGSFYKEQKVPHLNLVLYHVAAKVDLMWSVAEGKRINADPAEVVRLTYMGAQHLFNSDAYCFKPMRNESDTIIGGAGYDIVDIVTTSDEGLWWEGRDYFYTIPYVVTGSEDYFPLQMVMRTNGSAGTGYQPTLNLRIDTSAVFVPWLRAKFNLTQPLTDKTETITVD